MSESNLAEEWVPGSVLLKATLVKSLVVVHPGRFLIWQMKI